MKRRIIVGISGASGIPVAVEVLRQLKNMSDIETHLVYTESAERTITFETELSLMQIRGLAEDRKSVV